VPELRPEDYEALTGVAKDEYEQRLLAAVREAALAAYPPGSDDATIDAVELDGGSRDRCLVILFRIPQRPGCVFGSRARIWPAPSPDDEGTPEDLGRLFALTGIDEYVDQGGLVVRECVPGSITWLP